MNFEYPFIPNDMLLDQPHDVYGSDKWKGYTAYNVAQLKDKFPNNIIPVGTKLYHGSMDGNIKFDQPKLTFFGRDVVISLWILPEQRRSRMQEYYFKEYGYYLPREMVDLYNKTHKIGYLYEFEVVKEIEFHLIEKLSDHPPAVEICKTKPCLHSQIGPDAPKYNLSTELTMDMKYYKDYIQLNKNYG